MSIADDIRERIDDLAREITDRHAPPPHWRARCLEDARFHLQFLAGALDARSERMFLDYIGWVKVLLASRNVGERDLIANLEIVSTTLRERFGDDADAYLRAAIEQLPSMPDDVASPLDPRAPLWSVASEYVAALLGGDRREAARLVHAALDDGASLRDVYMHVFEPAQQEIGRLWQLNRVTVAQEHFCTAATQQIMTSLYGRIFAGEKREQRAVGMCVGGELHEVGLRIITDLLELDGWQTWYLGANVPPIAAVKLCVDRNAELLLVSATMTPHLVTVAEVIRVFRAEPRLAHAKVIVGGRAFRNEPELWRTIGADGYAANADDCLALISRLAA